MDTGASGRRQVVQLPMVVVGFNLSLSGGGGGWEI